MNNKRNKMNIIAANSAGLFNKLESFKRIVSLFKPGVILLQETKATRKNKLKLSNYVIFEHVRKETGGGGLLTAIHETLEPVSVNLEDEEELITVEAKLGNQKVRFINGYGPQENSSETMRKSFYEHLDLEVKRASVAGALICIEMDSNAKLGPKYIHDDPKPMSKNGELLAAIIEDNDLIVVMVVLSVKVQ